jgi:hypothetical protein
LFQLLIKIKFDNILSFLFPCQKLSTSSEQSTVGVASSFTTVAMAIIAIGMILQGIAKSPRQAFITIYIDNNVDKTKTAVYVGKL